MATENRNLKEVKNGFCPQYNTNVTLFIEPPTSSVWHLVAQYEKGGYEGRPEFAAGIPDDWTFQDVLRFIDIVGSKMYPRWEIPARVYGSAMLLWPDDEPNR
jgi:hypothetical protein